MGSFVELTRNGGQEILVNVDHVVSVKDRADDKNVVVTMADGTDFEVQDEYADIVNALMGSGPS